MFQHLQLQRPGVENAGLQLFNDVLDRGFAHGFVVLSESADFCYKCDAPYSPTDELVIRWNDPAIAIDWSIGNPTLSDAILDRVVHNAYRIELSGDSLRKKRTPDPAA